MMHTAPTHPASRPLQTLDVFAGGVEQLDGVLECAVAPAIRRAGPDCWFFVRCTDHDRPHVRLTLDAAIDIQAFAKQVRGRLEHACALPPREPLLPGAVSQRAGDGAEVGVRLVQAPAGDGFVDSLDVLSSEVVLAALAGLRSGRERCAYGLCLMTTIAQTALGRDGGPDLWGDAARRRMGSRDARRGSLLAGLTDRSDAMRGELVALGRALRQNADTAAGLARYADGCRELADAAAVRREAHRACNRLGVMPLEEVLLALVLAGAGTGARRKCNGSGAVIEFERVSKEHEERTVLKDLSLTVHDGEVFVIVGPPGAGKTSLLGIASGLRVLSQGTARVLGRDPRGARRELAQAPTLAMPDAELATESSVRENVELYLRASDTNGAGAVDAALEDVGLHEHAGTAVKDLSAGQRRRAAIACALVRGPAVLLLDEPTAGLSAVERDEIWRFANRRRDRGETTIIATTALQEALCVGDRACLLRAGSLCAIGDPAQLAADFFPVGSVHFHVVEKPDRELLGELPEIQEVEIDERADHWAVELATRQPRQLIALLEADPDFPEMFNIDEQGSGEPSASRQEA